MNHTGKLASLIALTIAPPGALLIFSGSASAQTEATLPVYQVAGPRGTERSASIASALKLAPERLTLSGDAVSFVDTDHVSTIPLRDVTTPAVAGASAARLQSIDFATLRARRVAGDDVARRAISGLLANARIALPSSARPEIEHTTFSASYREADGQPVEFTQPIDTRVAYHFTLSDHPLIGPGAVATATVEPDGSISRLHVAVRDLRPGPAVHVIPEAAIRERLMATAPNSKVDLKLVYFAPATESGPGAIVSPTTVIPYWSVSVATPRRLGGSGPLDYVISKTRLIPATDDPRFVPTARLTVSGQGGSRVGAAVAISGGRAPYRIAWGGSNPVLATQSGARVTYTPVTRAASLRARVIPAMETVSVTVIDANGVMAQAHQTIRVTAQAIGSLAVGGGVERDDSKGGGGSYGTESPREPDFAIDRVGWQTGMANSGGGVQRFAWLGASSWPGDFIEPPTKGSLPAKPWINGDADFSNWGVNTAAIVLNNTDGSADNFASSNPGAVIANYATATLSIPNSTPTVWVGLVGYGAVAGSQSSNISYNGSWGTNGPNDHLMWLAMDACDTLDDSDGNGKRPWQRWGPAFGGLHLLLGWSTEEQVGDGSFERIFGEKMLGVHGSPETVLDAWMNAATAAGSDHGKAAALGPVGPGGVTNMKDFYIGKGSTGPTIAASQITGWWYMRQN